MLDIAYRNVMRQRTRTALSALGILIGIGAIIALGSVSEGLRTMVSEEMSAIAGKVMVTQAGTGMSMQALSSDVTPEQLDELAMLSGVSEVVPIGFYMPIGVGFSGVSDWMAIGLHPSQIGTFLGKTVGVTEGEMLEEGDSGEVLIGSDVAERYNYVVGDTATVKETEFTIKGIAEKTDISDLDMAIIMNLEDFQDLVGKDSVQMAYVIPDNPAEAESLTDTINAEMEGLSAMSDKDIARTAEGIISTISFFTFSIGAIAAFVGGLSIMNTMIMSVMERKREIGAMKAMGATSSWIMKQIVTESAMISLIGAIGGASVGIALSFVITAAAGGAMKAVVTPGLLATGIGFAMVIGILGGLYPARQAVKMDPVEALRYE